MLVFGRSFSSSSESEIGRETCPPMSSFQPVTSTCGMSKWIRR